MHPSEGIEFIRMGCPVALGGSVEPGEAVARARPPLCPFGCAVQQHDDKGFCSHLVGFTDGRQDKNKAGELVTVYEHHRKVKGEWVTGEMEVKREDDGGVQEYSVWRILQPTDIIVHINNGKTGKSFAGTQWARVYRPKLGETPVFRPGSSQTPDMSQLQKVLAAQEDRIKKQELIIDKLVKEVGIPVDDLDLNLEGAQA
jgi:hypothetical protein